MAESEAYKLEMLSPLHVGERGVGMERSEETFHSDSLFSALCAVIREFEGPTALTNWLAAFLGPQPPALLSSTFPYCGDLLLLPRPHLRLRFGEEAGDEGKAEGESVRRLKDVAYVSPAIFEALLSGREMDEHLDGSCFLMGGRVWVTAEERAALPDAAEGLWWAGDPVPRVSVDRVSSRSAIFHVGRVYFRPGAGLYFLVKWNDEKWRPLFEEALMHLGDAGIGGERSAGHGQFRLSGPIPVSMSSDDGSSRRLTLSLYHPREDEVKAGVLDDASYDLLTRRGWIDSPESRTMRRKTVRMLREGSVVGPDAVGDIVDVTPDGFTSHRTYRYGLAFPIDFEEERDGS